MTTERPEARPPRTKGLATAGKKDDDVTIVGLEI